MGSRSRPPARRSRKQHAGISSGRTAARALSAGTSTLIQHDLLIYFHVVNDVNGSILMPCVHQKDFLVPGVEHINMHREKHMCEKWLIPLHLNIYLFGAKLKHLCCCCFGNILWSYVSGCWSRAGYKLQRWMCENTIFRVFACHHEVLHWANECLNVLPQVGGVMSTSNIRSEPLINSNALARPWSASGSCSLKACALIGWEWPRIIGNITSWKL